MPLSDCDIINRLKAAASARRLARITPWPPPPTLAPAKTSRYVRAVPTPSATPSLAIVLMGVAGSGKTVVGELLAKKLDVPFLDGDDFHPRANVEKMASGVPLDDADRWPWLDAVGAAIKAMSGKVGTGFPSDIASREIHAPAPKLVVACSALKRAYRERLAEAAGRPLLFVLLEASRETLARRLAGRRGHFMPASLLDSQLATLEPPGPSEKAIVVSTEATHVKVAETVIDALSRASFAG